MGKVLIGVLAIQGGFAEHEQILARLGLPFKEVRSLADVEGLTGLIIPGGESTVMGDFMRHYGLEDWLKNRVHSDPDFKVFGTCAGLILLARYGLLDVKVERNAYGRQVDSFVAAMDRLDSVDKLDKTSKASEKLGQIRGHFIRAPKILKMGSLAQLVAMHQGVPVLVRQGAVWGASFHPELADDERLHAAIFSC